MSATPAKIEIEDTVYELNAFYCEGAKAQRADKDPWDNPYQDGTQRFEDWEAGFDNEAAFEHRRFGIDLITEGENGKLYEHDPDIVRNDFGVDPDQFMN
ncbi:hypothetical protein [Salipiger mucosus]|uniref:Uncharacterized protein n=1 Tax=Salipiger mucosus DSM 16094 TaxID=1123237 RepID=S9QAT7_9RHOB|nr:hypothetical protein [Salipiger mucosus]EPX76753.1 hypothetical protein Salmuc_04639 [Salipiger mucosus DSM 16094]